MKITDYLASHTVDEARSLKTAVEIEQTFRKLLESDGFASTCKRPVVVIGSTSVDGTAAAGLMQGLARLAVAGYSHRAFGKLFGQSTLMTDNRIQCYLFQAGKNFRHSATQCSEYLEIKPKLKPITIIVDHGFNSRVFNRLYHASEFLVWIDHHVIPPEENDNEYDPTRFILYNNENQSTTKLVHGLLTRMEAVMIQHGAESSTEFMETIDFHDMWRYVAEPSHRLAFPSRYLNNWFYGTNHGLTNLLDLATDFMVDLNDIQGNSPLSKMEGIVKRPVKPSVRLAEYIKAGSYIFQSKDRASDSIVNENAMLVKLTVNEVEYSAIMAFHTDDFSRLCEKMLASCDCAEFALVVCVNKKTHSVKLTFRSRRTEDIDVQKIAASFGGGGQKNAAAAEISLVEFGKLIYSRMTAYVR